MKANKAIGLDKISARLLRDAAWVIAPPLTYIINSSLKLGKFPYTFSVKWVLVGGEKRGI